MTGILVTFVAQVSNLWYGGARIPVMRVMPPPARPSENKIPRVARGHAGIS